MDKLKEILEKHSKWLRGEKGGEQASLTDADLTEARLTGADLRWADLGGADMTGANLTGANLTGANLTVADLTGVDLTGVDLRWVDLRWADLTGVDLKEANLIGANLIGARLRGAKHDDTTKWPAFQIPQEGSLIVYKKLKGGIIAKLKVPVKAKRTASLVGRKCRAEYVKVLELSDGAEAAYSQQGGITYTVGQKVYPDSYDPNPLVECTNGIHFFLTREEAEAW